jgi:hypothetical protein
MVIADISCNMNTNACTTLSDERASSEDVVVSTRPTVLPSQTAGNI